MSAEVAVKEDSEMICNDCDALGKSCCQAAKARRETAIALAKIVTRQSEKIRELNGDLDATRQTLREIMALHAVKP